MLCSVKLEGFNFWLLRIGMEGGANQNIIMGPFIFIFVLISNKSKSEHCYDNQLQKKKKKTVMNEKVDFQSPFPFIFKNTKYVLVS